MTTSQTIPINGRLRILVLYCLLPANKLAVLLLRVIPRNIQVQIDGIRLIGDKKTVDDAVEVLTDLKSGSPDLFAALTARVQPVFCYCPWTEEGMSYMRYFFIGNEYLIWGKSGLLANFAWTAYKLQVNFHLPEISSRDYYSGRTLHSKLCNRMLHWLMDNDQPDEIVQSFRRLCSRNSIKATNE